MARRNAALTLRACRYRCPSRQPSRLCRSGCLRNAPCRPYLGGSWRPTCTYDDDLWLQVRTCLRVRTQKPMLLSQVSWSFSLGLSESEITHHDCFCSKKTAEAESLLSAQASSVLVWMSVVGHKRKWL